MLVATFIRLFKRAFFLSIAVSLAACVSYGSKEFTQADAEMIKDGITTEQEVLAMFGPPTNVGMASDGNKEVVYFFGNTNMNPATYIPFLGFFLGGSDTQQKTLIVAYDKNLVVKHSQYSETDVNASMFGSKRTSK